MPWRAHRLCVVEPQAGPQLSSMTSTTQSRLRSKLRSESTSCMNVRWLHLEAPWRTLHATTQIPPLRRPLSSPLRRPPLRRPLSQRSRATTAQILQACCHGAAPRALMTGDGCGANGDLHIRVARMTSQMLRSTRSAITTASDSACTPTGNIINIRRAPRTRFQAATGANARILRIVAFEASALQRTGSLHAAPSHHFPRRDSASCSDVALYSS